MSNDVTNNGNEPEKTKDTDEGKQSQGISLEHLEAMLDQKLEQALSKLVNEKNNKGSQEQEYISVRDKVNKEKENDQKLQDTFKEAEAVVKEIAELKELSKELGGSYEKIFDSYETELNSKGKLPSEIIGYVRAELIEEFFADKDNLVYVPKLYEAKVREFQNLSPREKANQSSKYKETFLLALDNKKKEDANKVRASSSLNSQQGVFTSKFTGIRDDLNYWKQRKEIN